MTNSQRKISAETFYLINQMYLNYKLEKKKYKENLRISISE